MCSGGTTQRRLTERRRISRPERIPNRGLWVAAAMRFARVPSLSSMYPTARLSSRAS
jgi:hypothetical protein